MTPPPPNKKKKSEDLWVSIEISNWENMEMMDPRTPSETLENYSFKINHW